MSILKENFMLSIGTKICIWWYVFFSFKRETPWFLNLKIMKKVRLYMYFIIIIVLTQVIGWNNGNYWNINKNVSGLMKNAHCLKQLKLLWSIFSRLVWTSFDVRSHQYSLSVNIYWNVDYPFMLLSNPL